MRKIIFAALMILAIPAHAADKNETGFERVMRTNTLRCGYYVFPPVTYRDPNTNELSGLSVDMMNAIAKRGNLKIEWTEEVNFANWAPALQSKRFDAVCTPMWPEIALARAVAFTQAMFYSALSPLVRADDTRFADDLDVLNNPDVIFVTQDGNTIDMLTREAFPKAKINTLPASADGPTVLQEIVTKKADVILLDRNGEHEYNKNNPVKLRLMAKDKPVKIQAFTLAVGRDDTVLKDFLDNAINDLVMDGSMERYLKKWQEVPDLFIPVKRPEVTK